MVKLLQIGLVLFFLIGLVWGVGSGRDGAAAVFQILLALLFLFSLVVWPFVNLQQQEIPDEDFQRDVRRGL